MDEFMRRIIGHMPEGYGVVSFPKTWRLEGHFLISTVLVANAAGESKTRDVAIDVGEAPSIMRSDWK